ncbi:zinc-finger domain-containing protein [Stenotrophomonas rhizophila]|uniref:zinc-finger domain-containing protein n=1 Tax=Stenotrophomonas rhizophila TaxID=216778 RepID=UPI003D2F90F4
MSVCGLLRHNLGSVYQDRQIKRYKRFPSLRIILHGVLQSLETLEATQCWTCFVGRAANTRPSWKYARRFCVAYGF